VVLVRNSRADGPAAMNHLLYRRHCTRQYSDPRRRSATALRRAADPGPDQECGWGPFWDHTVCTRATSDPWSLVSAEVLLAQAVHPDEVGGVLSGWGGARHDH
jgi:hypothetical protein